MKTTVIGTKAEAVVASHLAKNGWEILGLNWKTRVCEIDIVAKKGNIVYLVEVKFRKQDAQGDGLEYITTRKLNQMHFASQIWAQRNNWDGDCRLLAASVSPSGVVDILEVD
jgi:Holliday junction resolvase-like predicted endonuclease